MRIRQRIHKILPLFFIVVASGCAELLQPKLETDLREIGAGEYRLDKEHASLIFKVEHMGLSKYIGRFNDVDASLEFDPENIANSRLEAVVNMASVDVNNEKLERALRGRFWFDAESFPQASFITTAVSENADGTIEFTGNLNFMGVTKEILVQVRFNGAGNNLLTGKYTLGFAAEAALQRSDFGLDRFIPTVGDKVELEVHAEFQRQ